MVFLTQMLLSRSRKWPASRLPFFSKERTAPDVVWKRRRVRFLAGDFYGRKRNCYAFGIVAATKQLQYATWGRKALQKDQEENLKLRIEAGAEELFYDGWYATEALARCHIGLDKQ